MLPIVFDASTPFKFALPYPRITTPVLINPYRLDQSYSGRSESKRLGCFTPRYNSFDN